ncbi:MAG: hypothetical protein IBJ14_12540 [Hydrogenophaga sp.]|nr:hypothetical protein [Hydrogenophaga sp.]
MSPNPMDEADSMKVAPRAWQLLQDAWRGTQSPPREATGTAREPVSPAPSALAALAFGAGELDPHRHH